MGSVFEGRDPDDCMEGSYLVNLKQDEESECTRLRVVFSVGASVEAERFRYQGFGLIAQRFNSSFHFIFRYPYINPI